MAIEQTLSIIKPDAVSKNVVGKIISRFEDNGLHLVAGKLIHLTDEMASGFYAEHEGRPFFNDLKKEYSNGFYVHITEERQDLKQTVGYVGRYARRPPMSELRIKKYDGEYICFEFKNYRNNGSKQFWKRRSNS